ncbi:MAG TPA: alpha/beta hydrolase [Actinomycetes bacterium]|nr:alpha/beta hydrolase [Actinomycetes bacterium]
MGGRTGAGGDHAAGVSVADTLVRLARPPGSRDAGTLLAGLALGVGAGVAIERAVMRTELRRADPEAAEPFGRLPGRPAAVTSWDGTRLHVEQLAPAGEAAVPCLVFAHGLALRGDAWHYQRRDLPASFRCVFADTRGHGRSGPAAAGGYSLEALARDLHAVLGWAGERVVLVTHSMSGMAALTLAKLEPERFAERVAGLVLVSTTYADALESMVAALAAGGGDRVQRALYLAGERLAGQDPRWGYRLRRRGSDVGYLGTRLFGFGPGPSPSQVAWTDRLLARTDADVWVQVMPAVLGFDLGEVLPHVRVPALVVAGDADRLTPIASARHMAGRIPGARLVVLPGAGHMAFLEAHEPFNRELAAFARQAGAPAGGPGSLRRP